MKLRTSFFNGTVLKKDITRFAPLWAVYFVGGMLVMLSTINISGNYAAEALSQTISVLAVTNLIYAALCAQLLFGDLFQTRMCNALHAMPLRRECWFGTHVISGIAFSLVPHTVAAVWMAAMLGKLWFVAFIWLLGLTLQYLFFFGLAVFSVFCVGNRWAQMAVYGILNFGSMILYWFVNTIYAPLLYGVRIPEDPFVKFCPVVSMAGNGDYVLFEYVEDAYAGKYYEMAHYEYRGFGEGWGYLTVCAVLGVVLLGLALLLYRRRRLETAGNFMAVKPMEPIFAVVFTLCAGAVFAAVGQLFGTGYEIYLIVGLILGWFVGQMLLKRTVKVFHWKTFVKLGVLGVAMVLSLVVTSWDPLGITSWMPEKNEIAYVEVNRGSSISTTSSMYLKFEASEDIDEALSFHEAVIEEGGREPSGGGYIYATSMTIRYTLKNGKTVSRYYTLYSGTAGYNGFQALYSDPEELLGYTDWESFVNTVKVFIEGYGLDTICQIYEEKYGTKTDHETMRRELLEALKKDVEAGTIAPDWAASKGDYLFSVSLQTDLRRYVSVYTEAENTRAWYEAYEEILTAIVLTWK